MRSFAISAFFVIFASAFASAAEPWADAKLPIKDSLLVWLDASRQAAAWQANDKEIVTGDALDVVFDASGHGRHFTQGTRDAQPKLIVAQSHAAIRFDGNDDHLAFTGAKAELKTFTAFVVASPRSNAGFFRALVAASRIGSNDYATGFNIDFGPNATPAGQQLEYLNVEGAGFVGARSLVKEPISFDDFAIITVTCGGKVSARLDGKPSAEPRDRWPVPIRADQLIVGARTFSNDSAPYVQGFFDGDIAEVLLFDRALSDDEIAKVEQFLQAKHTGAATALARASSTGKELKPVENPPDVQMFLPGFTWKKLPLELTNINNLRYRDDGKLVALAYDGNVYLLADTDGDGLEDKATLFWDNAKAGANRIASPIGMALTPPDYPHGRGLLVAGMRKLSLIVDTDGDDKADKEIVVADGWPGSFHQVDALGVAIAPDHSIYFGIGCANFADPLMIDKETGDSKYDLKSERGTILRVSPDLKQREIVCTGIRFPVGLAFNRDGDLFATDQEGATWCPNGNPFDELLHIQPGRHYGFPPRHPKHLPDVIDEPSTFDYTPQHQSTCGLVFNEPFAAGARVFGPMRWQGDAIVCGEARGKLYRTKLTKTPAGYVAQTQVIGSIPMLLIDATISPTGDLVVCCHSGAPDWGTGPTGKGALYKISYHEPDQPQPLFAHPAGAGEVRVIFDRPLDPSFVHDLAKRITIDYGEYVGPGDRFEAIRPGYAAVRRQLRSPRHELRITGVQISQDHRALIVTTSPQPLAVSHDITFSSTSSPIGDIDLAYDLTGVIATWTSADGKTSLTTWLPHVDLDVSRAFTAGSAEHEAFFRHLRTPGKLTLRTQLALDHMLRPRVQPGSTLDYTLPPEIVTVTFSNGKTITATPTDGQLIPVELELPTGSSEPTITAFFTTTESDTPRPLQLTRFLLPWARLAASRSEDLASNKDLPQLKNGDWLRGREIFFGNEAGCAKCHTVAGRGSDVGPDLSNLIHRDYDSVLRDIREPSAALNPDYIASTVTLNDGSVIQGIRRHVDDEHFLLRGDAKHDKTPLAMSNIRRMRPSPISMMPTGLPEGLGEEKMRDLLTFLLTEPLAPSPIDRKGAPPPRSRSEFEHLIPRITPTSQPTLRILLVAGPKDHGPCEHDYPLLQKRWTTLLGLAENVIVDQAELWPSEAQWQSNDVVVFYCANQGFNAERARDLDRHLTRGGGLVYLHWAVNGQKHPHDLAQRIGLASALIKFRHGPLDLDIRDLNHPITRGLSKVSFIDESYWHMTGDESRIHLLADTVEEGQPRPILWTMDHNPGRVFVSILGHYTWTFDDPLFRLLVLRAISWTAGQHPERLVPLATIGARIQ